MEDTKSKEYYGSVFYRLSILLRVVHRKLNFGHISVIVNRKSFNIRWTVRRKNCRKFVYDIPLNFNDLADTNLTNADIYQVANEFVVKALETIPKELIRTDDE